MRGLHDSDLLAIICFGHTPGPPGPGATGVAQTIAPEPCADPFATDDTIIICTSLSYVSLREHFTAQVRDVHVAAVGVEGTVVRSDQEHIVL
jgi:hypothetical protein